MWFPPNGYHVARYIGWIRISFITQLIIRPEKKKKKNLKNVMRYYRDSRSAKSREQGSCDSINSADTIPPCIILSH